MSSATKSDPRFRAGDWVSYPVGFRRALAQVVEDRGPVGTQGRRLYQLQIDRGEDGGTSIEVPEADLEPAPKLQRRNSPIKTVSRRKTGRVKHFTPHISVRKVRTCG